MQGARRAFAVVTLLLLAVPVAAQDRVPFGVDLGANGFDLEVDSLRGRLYVSLPDTGEVAILSLETFGEIGRITVGSRPLGIDVSLDQSQLFVALNGAGAVAVVDLETLQVSQVSVAQVLADARTFDVLEVSPGRVFATASPGSSSFANVGVIVMIDMETQTMRVASNRILRATPTLAAAPDGQFVYVGEGFSPNSLIKLDNRLPNAPILSEAPFGSVSGTNRIALSGDGVQLYLGSGQVLDAESLLQIGLTRPGIPRSGLGSDVVFVASSPPFGSASTNLLVNLFETATFSPLPGFEIPCAQGGLAGLQDFEVAGNDSTFLVLSGARLCGILDTTVGDLDRDDDEVLDPFDNCPDDPNPDQLDMDADQLGDACDPFPLDADNLGACLVDRSSLASANDLLRDQIGLLEDENAELRTALADADGDGIANVADLCPLTPEGARVDGTGCSREQFCEAISIDSFGALFACTSRGFAGSRLAACRVRIAAEAPSFGLRCSAR